MPELRRGLLWTEWWGNRFFKKNFMKNELQDLYNIIDSHGDFHCFNIIDYINQLIKDNQDVYDEF